MDTPRTRDDALAARPPAITDNALERYAWVRTRFDFDEACIQLLDVSTETNGVLVRRQVWWFEEETLRWTLDESLDWWMPSGEARVLLQTLNQALSPR